MSASRVRHVSVVGGDDDSAACVADELVRDHAVRAPDVDGRPPHAVDTRRDKHARDRPVVARKAGVSLWWTPRARTDGDATGADADAGTGAGAGAAAGAGAGAGVGAGAGATPRLCVNIVLPAVRDDGTANGVTQCMRVCDAAVVVVVVEVGVTPAIEGQLRTAIAHLVRPLLVITGIGAAGLRVGRGDSGGLETLYQRMHAALHTVNAVITDAAGDDRAGGWVVDVRAGTVVFADALQRWGFTLDDFARMYALWVQRTRRVPP